jgi:hypothetical protein
MQTAAIRGGMAKLISEKIHFKIMLVEIMSGIV